MGVNASMARDTFTRLRRKVSEIEGRPVSFGGRSDTPGPNPTSHQDRPVLPFDIPDLDGRLGGGLRRDALHEVRSETTRDWGSATGFAGAILTRLVAATNRPVLWVVEENAIREGGALHGTGLAQFGFDPARLFVVATRRTEEALWVFEEGLRCTGLGGVLAEIRGHPKALDLTASRRLALRARDHGVMGLLLRQAAAPEPGAAATRWHVTPQPAATLGDFPAGIGKPVWHLELERNRTGPTGRFDLEWDHGIRSFALAGSARPALPRPRFALSGHRPAPAEDPRSVVAYRRAG